MKSYPRPTHARVRFWLGVGAIALNVGLVATGTVSIETGLERSAEHIAYLVGTMLGAGYSIAQARSSAEQDMAAYVNARRLEKMLADTERRIEALRGKP